MTERDDNAKKLAEIKAHWINAGGLYHDEYNWLLALAESHQAEIADLRRQVNKWEAQCASVTLAIGNTSNHDCGALGLAVKAEIQIRDDLIEDLRRQLATPHERSRMK